MFAQSIHNASRRRQSPFVAVNCAAIPDTLIESELFGYEEGAFTGARKGGKQGLFQTADNGTIFLDEIGDIPLSLQSRLLRVLEEREVMPVGSTSVIPIDVRVICATNRNLNEMVRQGTFREDLYYRLKILPLVIPPLRERVEDIPELLHSMAEGARLTFRDHDLRLIFISGFLGFFAFGAFDSLESLFYRDVLNVDIVWLGWLSSVVGLTSSVGAFILTKLSARHVNLRLLLGALMAVGIGSMVYVGTDMLGVAIVGQAINGLAWGFLEPLQMILIQERADIKYLGRITGFVRFGLMSAGVVPLLAAPFLAEALGVQTVLFGASTIIALVGTLFFVTQGRRRGR